MLGRHLGEQVQQREPVPAADPVDQLVLRVEVLVGGL
jgi:hypothetical protein